MPVPRALRDRAVDKVYFKMNQLLTEESLPVQAHPEEKLKKQQNLGLF
jgi:hypothetical protein